MYQFGYQVSGGNTTRLEVEAPPNGSQTRIHSLQYTAASSPNPAKWTLTDADNKAATLELKRATGNMSQGSVNRGPLVDWWQEGLKRVRVVGP